MEKQTQQPKGYGFCEFIDKDIASSALRNLSKYDLNKRELKVDFASDNKNGTNLRPEDITYRDTADLNLVFAGMSTLSSTLKQVPLTGNNLATVSSIVNSNGLLCPKESCYDQVEDDNFLLPLALCSSQGAVEETLKALPLKY